MRTSLKAAGGLSGGDAGGTTVPSRHDPQTTAWVVLWAAFIVFWALIVGASVGAKRYYDTATLPQAASLSLEQGIVLFRDAVTSTLINAHDDLLLRERDELLVGQGARASVSLFDGSQMRLYPGSQIVLREMRKSRFHDSFARTSIEVQKGTVRLEVVEPSVGNREFRVLTPHGYALLTQGNFGFEVSSSQSRVSARHGSATAASGGGTATAGPGEKLLLSQKAISGPIPEGDQLMVNGDFSQGFAGWEFLTADEPGRPVEPGRRTLLTDRVQEREVVAVRFLRVSPRATHGEIGLTQVINKDVSDYLSLQLHANVRVDEQSLSGGGYMGYEYPIMLRVHYRDATGSQIDWSHGFFHKNPEGRPTPNGEEVPQGQWVAYLGELMEVRPKPAHIISIDVLGAGHSFDGMVSNVGLIGK